MLSADHPKKLFLLDAYALIYRAYFAFSKNPRVNSKGQNTSAAFGFTNVLIDVIKNEKGVLYLGNHAISEQELKPLIAEAKAAKGQ